MYKRKLDLCLNRINDFRLNLVILNENFFKFTEFLKTFILYFLKNKLCELKFRFKFVIHDHLRIIR